MQMGLKLQQRGEKMFVAETASPLKFADTIYEALGRYPARPNMFMGIEELPKRVMVMQADANEVKSFIRNNCPDC